MASKNTTPLSDDHGRGTPTPFYGVFEEFIIDLREFTKDLTRITHECGGQVYMDGANLNARPRRPLRDGDHFDSNGLVSISERRCGLLLHGRFGADSVVRAGPVRPHELEMTCGGRLPPEHAQDVLHSARGGGPGVGAIGVNAHLAPFLPGIR